MNDFCASNMRKTYPTGDAAIHDLQDISRQKSVTVNNKDTPDLLRHEEYMGRPGRLSHVFEAQHLVKNTSKLAAQNQK